MFDINSIPKHKIIETGEKVILDDPGHGSNLIYLLPSTSAIEMGAIDPIFKTPLQDPMKAVGIIHENGVIVKSDKWVALEDVGCVIRYRGRDENYFNKHVCAFECGRDEPDYIEPSFNIDMGGDSPRMGADGADTRSSRVSNDMPSQDTHIINTDDNTDNTDNTDSADSAAMASYLAAL